MYSHAHAYMEHECTHAKVHAWELEESLWELILTFYHVDSRDWTWVVKLDDKNPSLLSPIFIIYKYVLFYIQKNSL